MADPHFEQDILRDPFSSETRAERRNLLLMSTVSLFVVVAGLLPEKISALGIEFTATNQNAFLILLLCGTIYFLVAFLLYALTDIRGHRVQQYLSETSELVSGLTRVKSLREELIRVGSAVKQAASSQQEAVKELEELVGEVSGLVVGVRESLDLSNVNPPEDASLSGSDGNDQTPNRERLGKAKQLHEKAVEDTLSFYERDAKAQALFAEHDELSRQSTILLSRLSLDRAQSSKRLANLRLAFDFLVPLGVAGYAIFHLLRAI